MRGPKQDGDTQKMLLRELSLMFSVLRPFAEVPSSTMQGYAMMLDDLTAAQVLTMVPLVLRKRWDFPPQPAELRDMVLENDPTVNTRESREDCPTCGGTGYKIVDENGARKAAPCDCRQRKAASA